MVRRLLGIAAVIMAVLVLGSCSVLQFVFGSVFPSTMTLIKAQVDLSKIVPKNNNGPTNLRLVEVSGHSYVVITGSPSATEHFAFFYDLDLNLVKSFAGANAPGGDGVMVDASGLIALGNQLLNPDLSVAGPNTSGTTITSQGSSGADGFVDGPGGRNVAGIFTSPSQSNVITYSSYSSVWAAGSGTPMTQVLSNNFFNLQVNALLDDGAPTGNMIMVISQGSTGGNGNSVSARFLVIPKSAFTTGPFPTTPLDSAPQRDNLDGGSFGYADGSIFAYDTKTSSLVRIDPANGSTRGSFDIGGGKGGKDNSQLRYVYRLSGDVFYSFDTDSRILTKYVAWW